MRCNSSLETECGLMRDSAFTQCVHVMHTGARMVVPLMPATGMCKQQA